MRELEARIKADAYGTGASAGQITQNPGDLQAQVPRLSAKRGELHIYRVRDREGRWMLDLGFKAHRRLPGKFASAFEARAGEIYRDDVSSEQSPAMMSGATRPLTG